MGYEENDHRLEDKIDAITSRLDRWEETLFGSNGTKGILTRLALIEEFVKSHKWGMGILIGAVITNVVQVVTNLI